MTTQQVLRDFIVREIALDRRPDELHDDYPLISEHIIDSLGIFTVMGFMESRFGVEVLDEELVPANFGTIGGMARLVEEKVSARDR